MFANLPWNAIQDGHLSWEDSRVEAHINQLIDECHWYIDAEGFLYIVDFEAEEVHGPACEDTQEAIADALWTHLKNDPGDDYGAAEFASKLCECEVRFVPNMLRSFCAGLGFYNR